jgi:hypothetical protein
MRRSIWVFIAAVTWGVAAVSAHHAFSAEFDANQPIRLEGKVVKLEWINPHAWIYIDVVGKDGKTTNWGIEAGAPNALLRRGWNKNSLPVGTKIVVEGFQAKNGASLANGRTVTFSDGRKLFVGTPGSGAPEDPK